MPIMIQLTDDYGNKVYINANHIISMMPYTLRKKEYTKVDTGNDAFYVEEKPVDILTLIRIAAGK